MHHRAVPLRARASRADDPSLRDTYARSRAHRAHPGVSRLHRAASVCAAPRRTPRRGGACTAPASTPRFRLLVRGARHTRAAAAKEGQDAFPSGGQWTRQEAGPMFRAPKVTISGGTLKSTPRRRILTGDRPTGKLHLGHWLGSIRNRVRLQDEYECFFIIADLHTLTTKPEKDSIAQIPGFIREIVLDYLSVGIDPQ